MGLTGELKDVAKNVRGERRFVLLVDATCRDDARPNVGNVFALAGLELTSCAEHSNGRGEMFFAVEGSAGVRVELPAEIYRSRHPYDAGVYDPLALQVIGGEEEAPVWP